VKRVAIVGCGVIAPAYAGTLSQLDFVEISACTDQLTERASALAGAHEIPSVVPFEDVLADPAVDAIINLTPPLAHHAVSSAALTAGKAVFSEKPLGVALDDGRALVALAAARDLRLGCAPDTFLGAGFQTCRDAVLRGLIGEPIAANAFMLSPGPERWHPHPDIFYREGAGPLFDMGPYYLTALVQLLGPARTVTGAARITHATRTIGSEPRRGEVIPAEVPTHVSSVIEFASGAIATMVTSFDVVASRYRNLEIYGTEATLSVPDPNTFGGPVRIRDRDDTEWRELPLRETALPQRRGIGAADMLWAMNTGRGHRASAELALHVLELMAASYAAARTGQRIAITSNCTPAPLLPAGLPPDAFDD
jgi:predicted dehydrogenase